MIPFLKWAGGKRWLFTSDFIQALPAYNQYIEPFLGGGAGFFALEPKTAILSDVNPELIELYEVVRDHPAELYQQILIHHVEHCKEYYYKMRSIIPNTKIRRAARTLYLNRTCWNGLYRKNVKGSFNVPIGTKNSVILETDDFEKASNLLSGVEIRNSDFESTIDIASAGDLVFVDPPYAIDSALGGFLKYNEKIFSWQDQVRLKNAVVRAAARGAKVLVSNASHPSVKELYCGVGVVKEVQRASVLAGKKESRGSVHEILVSI